MGKSAKLTRGGNKRRANIGRQQAKLKAQGIKDHVKDKTAKKEVPEGQKKDAKKRIAEALRSHAKDSKPIVKMAAKPATEEPKVVAEEEK